MTLTAGQRPASPEAIPRREQLTERLWPDAVTGDKGYSRAAIRNWLLHWEIEAVLPYRQGERGPHESDRALDRERPVIERTINRLTPFRRIATRSEKLASTYLAMVAFAMILEWL